MALIPQIHGLRATSLTRRIARHSAGGAAGDKAGAEKHPWNLIRLAPAKGSRLTALLFRPPGLIQWHTPATQCEDDLMSAIPQDFIT